MLKTKNQNILEHYFKDYRETNKQIAYNKCNSVSYTNDIYTQYSYVADSCCKEYGTSGNDNPLPQRNYKDTIFRMLFSDRATLLTLYNAVNGTSHDNPDDLEITTLENAIYMSFKNDVSCLIDMRLALFEQQSTVNPNIPLRNLDYVARILSKLNAGKDIYSTKLINIPNPKFIVFYNGREKQPAIREYRLSDAYVHKKEKPNLELIVTQININKGYNDGLMEKCRTLREYMLYVERVRTYCKDMSLTEAVMLAVDECIKEDILKDFLLKNKSEVITMSFFEYDDELHKRTLYEEGKEDGMLKGMTATISILKNNNFSNEKIIENIMDNFDISYDELIQYI